MTDGRPMKRTAEIARAGSGLGGKIDSRPRPRLRPGHGGEPRALVGRWPFLSLGRARASRLRAECTIILEFILYFQKHLFDNSMLSLKFNLCSNFETTREFVQRLVK